MKPSVSWLDLKLGVRMLVKYPGLSLVGILGIAVSVAIGASVFSVLDVMFRRALPLDEGSRVIAIQNWNAALGQPDRRTLVHDLQTWRREIPAVREIGAYRMVDRNLITADGQAEPVRIAEMSASGFRVARVPPLLGRYLAEDDERKGAPPVVVIGYEVWRNRFAGDRSVIGRTVQLGSTRHTIVGVMPKGFAFPIHNRVWTPLRLDPADYRVGEAPPVDVFGRLAPGATMEQAQAQLATVGKRLAKADPATHEHVRPLAMPYTRAYFGGADLPWAYYLLQVLVAILLVVIAVNVAILVYARTASRAGEIAVRLALGARRGRVVGQLFAEALVLSAVAAAVGLGASRLALQQVDAFVSRLGEEEVPFWWNFRLSPATVLYVAGLAVLAAVIVGALPALKVTGRHIQPRLRQLGGGGMQMGRTWTALIVAQVAVAVTIVPLVAALGWNQFFRYGITGPGFPADELLSARVGMDRETPPSEQAEAYGRQFATRLADRQSELVRRLEAEPGVAAVTFTSHLPGDWLAQSGVQGTVQAEDARPAAERTPHEVRFLQVDPRLFEVFGVPVLAGRSLHAADLAGTTTAVVANRSFVEQVLGGGAAVGRRFRYTRTETDALPGGVKEGGWYQVVGVVNDFPAKKTVTGRGLPVLYHPVAPGRLNPVSLVVRMRGVTPEAFAGRLREITTAVDPALRLSRVQPLAQLHRQKMRTEGLATMAVVVVTLSVLLLAGSGIHALMSFSVVQRRREIGIRTALGGQPRRILESVFARALRQLSLGAVIGCVLGGALMWGQGFTAGLSAAVLLALAAIVLSVGLLAALGPARRGLRIEPTEALRADA
jgi:putative ABC transport system permease protein